LLSVEDCLASSITCFGGVHTGAVLLQRVLGIADFNSDLVLQLIQPHFRLAILELCADLVGLRCAVAEGNGQLDARTFIGAVLLNKSSSVPPYPAGRDGQVVGVQPGTCLPPRGAAP